MFKKILLVSGIFALAFAVLIISIFDASSVRYPKSVSPHVLVSDSDTSKIDYSLPYAGRVLPDSPLWFLKAMRDKVWYIVTPSPLKRAELALLFSDKRLVMAEKLFQERKPETALATFTKGEKYLEVVINNEAAARKGGYDTTAFLGRLALSSLKHLEIAESLIPLAPEDVKPLISRSERYAKWAYEEAKNGLYSKDLPVPKNPFARD